MYPFLPYPPNDGGRIGFFNPIKYLSRKHELSVVCLTEGEGQEASIKELREFCGNLRTHRRATWQDPYRLLKGIVSSPPGAGAKYWHRAMGKLIREAIQSHKPDVVEFHHLNTAIYRDFAGTVPAVLREHNVEYKVWERYAESAQRWAERVYGRWTAPRVRRYEARAASVFDRCVVVSEADAVHLREISPTARIEIIPSGVDTEYFFSCPEVNEEPWSLTVIGSFEWKPKQQSLRVLLTQIFPKIKEKLPKAKLYVVGRGIPKQLEQLARATPGAVIQGPVPDVRPYIANSALLMNYLESGGGIALKVLEAMAMRKPVLCNSLGCEGIPVAHRSGICVADGVDDFASAAIYLLKNQAARRSLAAEGYRRVVESYSWAVVANRFEDFYQSVIEEHHGLGKVAQSVRAQYAC